MPNPTPQLIGIWKHYACESVTSTNDLARVFMRKNNHPLLVTASFQSAGRGQFGRRWETPPNTNLLMTFAVPAHCLTHNLPAFAVAIALCNVLRAFSLPVTSKWPNDIICNNRKMAGILIEKDDCGYYIGIGINTLYPKNKTHTRTSCVAEGIDLTNTVVLNAIAESLPHFLTCTAENIIAQYKNVWRGKGSEVIIRDGNMRGTVQGIDETGALIVYSNGIHHKIYSSGMLRYTSLITDELHTDKSLTARSTCHTTTDSCRS
jgi:BirA family transcriptional regulator, biotin operon repressor / biotin---[acetyl-CoA-carboxylase] ligase